MPKLDITSTAFEKGIDLAKEFADRLIGPAIDETGLLFKDKISYWRLVNQVKVLNKAKALTEKNGIDPKAISLKLLVPLLENASLEEDEELQNRWAILLSNMVDSAQNIENHVFPYILSQLSIEEYKALQSTYESKLYRIQSASNQLKEHLSTKDDLIKDYKEQIESLSVTAQVNFDKCPAGCIFCPCMSKDEQIVALRHEVAQLRGLLTAAMSELADMRQRLSKNSHNSDQPPSRDGLTKKPALPRKRGSRKPGGQPGHPGKTLKMVTRPDHRVVHPVPTRHCKCGCDLSEVSPRLDGERRQVFDLPPTLLEVTEHRLEHKTCPDCQRFHLALFPGGVNAPVQYGERVRSLAVLLNVEQSMPLARTQELFAGLTGYGINEATIHAAVERTYDKLEAEERIIHQAVLKSSVAHSDETGARIQGSLHWVHSFSSLMYTLYVVYKQRGGEVINGQQSHLAGYAGRLVHDSLNSYLTMAGELTHSLCNAHLLRELTALMELPDALTWPAKMHTLLLDFYRASDYGKGVVSPAKLWELDQRYSDLLVLADREEPPPQQGKRGRPKQSKGRNLAHRFAKWRESVLAFSRHTEVPFTNNLGERDLRPWKTKLKVAGCFRTRKGAEYYARIKGFCSTAKKHGHTVFDELVNVQKGASFLRLT